ncbi:MAG: shikimate dehydrogenase [Chthoniobacterales bacterium]
MACVLDAAARRPYRAAVKDFYTLADLEKWNEPGIRLGVIGDPVAHSRSPQMINAALQHCGLDMQYARFQIASDELETALRLLASHNFVGVNLTIPHKLGAAPLMNELDDFARNVGAVNCVCFAGAQLIGFNTDGPGFSRAIRSEFSVDLRDLRVLLFGAGGGAGNAIALQCAMEGCERLVLVNRTFEKAAELARELRPFFQEARVLGPVARLEAVEWDEAGLRFQIGNTDLVINATSLGMKRSDAPVLPPSMLAPHLIVYDTVYEPARTPLLAAAADAGARGANGLSMLLYQGALSFERWFDRAAPLEVMRSALL